MQSHPTPELDCIRSRVISIDLAQQGYNISMAARDKRKDIRVTQYLRARLAKADLPNGIEGETENLSQGGAFVRTSDWGSFRLNERTVVTLFLPPAFSGQKATIGLQGAAIITRIDEENEGVALEFVRSFRQFERIDEPEVCGKFRYKKLGHYLEVCGEMPQELFAHSFPGGFFVEKTQRLLDKDVIFQFSTKSFDDQEIFDQLKEGLAQPDALEARVIELHKRRAGAAEEAITVGRSPQNDIVLYNRLISKNHAHLFVAFPEGECHLLDLGSTNGTLLNGNRLNPHQKYKLADGDEVSFGPQAKIVYFSPKTFYDFLLHVKRQAS